MGNRNRNDGEVLDTKFSKDEILDGMEEDNLMLKNNVMDRVVDESRANQQMLASDDDDKDDEDDDSMDEITFIRNLSDKEKAKLMKKFLKLQNGEGSSKTKKKKKKEKK